MTTSTLSRRAALGWLAALAGTPLAAAAATPPAELPGNSIYQLRPPLTDQHGRSFELGSLRSPAHRSRQPPPPRPPSCRATRSTSCVRR